MKLTQAQAQIHTQLGDIKTNLEKHLNQIHRTRARLLLLRDERTPIIHRELTRILEK